LQPESVFTPAHDSFTRLLHCLEPDGVQVIRLPHDIRMMPGEEVVIFTLVEPPGFGEIRKKRAIKLAKLIWKRPRSIIASFEIRWEKRFSPLAIAHRNV
jgi:hypothetical protein